MHRRLGSTLSLLALLACSGPDEPGGRAAATLGPGQAWQRLSEVPTPRTEVAAATDGTRIWVAGGFAEDGSTVPTVEVYDPGRDAWSDGPDLPEAVNHAMAAAADGTVVVLGGYREGLGAPSDRGFALTDGRWRELPRMPAPRAAGGVAAAGGRLYVVGGVGPDGLAATTFVFDPASESWSEAAGLPTPREHLGVASDGTLVYAVGGRTGGIGSNLGAAEVFDPDAGTWESLPEMPTPRGGLAAAATANGFVVAPGGEADATFDEVEAYETTAGAWLPLLSMPTARHGVGVVAVGDTVYVIAGGTEPGLSVSGANEALDLGLPGD